MDPRPLGPAAYPGRADENDYPLDREGRISVCHHAMKSCHRAWNIARRRNPKAVPRDNPFSRMGLRGPKRLTPTATCAELKATMAKLDELGIDISMCTWSAFLDPAFLAPGNKLVKYSAHRRIYPNITFLRYFGVNMT